MVDISCEYIHTDIIYKAAYSVQEVPVPVFSCFSTNDLEEEEYDLTSSVLSYWVAGFLSSFVTVHVSIKNGFSWLLYLFCDSC